MAKTKLKQEVIDLFWLLSNPQRLRICELLGTGAAQTTDELAELLDAGVTPTVKHFPGFGRATENTDDAPTRLRITQALAEIPGAAAREALAERVLFAGTGDVDVDAGGLADGYTLPGDLDTPSIWSETVPSGGATDGLAFEDWLGKLPERLAGAFDLPQLLLQLVERDANAGRHQLTEALVAAGQNKRLNGALELAEAMLLALRDVVGPGLFVEPRQDAEHGDRRVTRFSGGMQRRLDLAVSLIHTPEVLFLDEPSAGLDPISSRLLDDLILAGDHLYRMDYCDLIDAHKALEWGLVSEVVPADDLESHVADAIDAADDMAGDLRLELDLNEVAAWTVLKVEPPRG